MKSCFYHRTGDRMHETLVWKHIQEFQIIGAHPRKLWGAIAKWLSLFYLAKKLIILFLSSDLWIIHSSRDEISLLTSTSGSNLANENACMNFLDDDWRKVALDLEVCSQSETLTAPTALNKEEL